MGQWVKIIADDQLLAGEITETSFNLLSTCDANSKKFPRMLRLDKSGILKMHRTAGEEKPRLEIVPLGAPGTDGTSFVSSDKIVTMTPILNGKIIEDLEHFYAEPKPRMSAGTNSMLRTQ